MSAYSKLSESRKQKMRETSRQWRLRNPDSVRRANIRSNLREYGLTVEEFDKLLIEQLGRCVICSRPMVGHKEPHVDHDHVTGKVRGLLCKSCNLILGCADDSDEVLLRAIVYLRGGQLC